MDPRRACRGATHRDKVVGAQVVRHPVGAGTKRSMCTTTRSGRSPSWVPAAPVPPSRSRSHARGWRCTGGGRSGGRLAERARGGRAPGRAARARSPRSARAADVVIVATPDAAIANAGAALAPGLRRGRARCCTSRVRAPSPSSTSCGSSAPTSRSARCTHCSRSRRPRSASLGFRARGARSTATPMSTGSQCRSACARSGSTTLGAPRTTRPRPSRPTISSRSMGQVARLADAAGVPPAALLPLVRSTLDNVEAHGPASALTGPIQRGDVDTVARHLEAIPDDEQRAYRVARGRGPAPHRSRRSALRELLDDPIPEPVPEAVR